MINFVGLDMIVFHDLTVESIKLQLDSNISLELVVLPYNKELKKYCPIKIIFGDFEYCRFSNFDLSRAPEIEVAEFDYRKEQDMLVGKMTFLSGFGEASFTIEFKSGIVGVKDHVEQSIEP